VKLAVKVLSFITLWDLATATESPKGLRAGEDVFRREISEARIESIEALSQAGVNPRERVIILKCVMSVHVQHSPLFLPPLDERSTPEKFLATRLISGAFISSPKVLLNS
jgi:hypothetical protein